MKTLLVLASSSLLVIAAGCSRNHRATTTPNKPSQAKPPSSAPATASVSAAPTIPLPMPTVAKLFPEPWRPEPVDDHLGGAMVLKRTSVDGKYDLIIFEKGLQAFPGFAKHGRWEEVYDRAAKGKLLTLRVKFEDGLEKQVEWDELAYGTEEAHAVLWSYPVNAISPAGAISASGQNEPIGGDKLLIKDMTQHRAMLLEVEPGVAAQFELSGLGNELLKIRPMHTDAVLSASQTIP